MKHFKIYILFLISYSSLLFGSLYDIRCNNIALQTADNKLVTTGFVFRSSNDQAFLTSRYNVDGSLDTTFGASGTVITQFTSSTSSRAYANAIQSDGKCVAVGATTISGVSQLAVARYTTAGVLDSSFNTTGTVNIAVNDGANAQDVVIQPANQFIVAAGSTMSGGQTRLLVVRLDTAGALDTSFNGSGIVAIVIGEHTQANAVVMGPSNTIVVAGYVVINGQRQVMLARFTSGGVLDATFGTGGIVTTAFGVDDYAADLAILATGQIIITGKSNNRAFTARYTSAGVLDTSYGTSGVFYLTAVGQNTYATSVAIQSDSKAVVTGYTDTQLFVARLITTGNLDITFNTIGYRITPLGGESIGTSILVQADGDIVSAGNFDYSTFLQRLLTNGSFDTSFSQNGVATQPQGLPSPTFFGNSVVVDKVYGNDTTGKRNWQPFLTVNAALNAAMSGDTCYIMPGIYLENGIKIPDNVSIKGLSQSSVTITWNATAGLSLIEMGNNTSIENVTVELTSSANVPINGIVFLNNSALTSYVKDCTIIVDNSLAPDGSNTVVAGILSSGTGNPAQNFICVDGCSIKVRSNGGGVLKHGIVVSSASTLNVRDTVIDCAPAGGSASYYGVQTLNNASAQCNLTTCVIRGTTADISQVTGTIRLTDTCLVSTNADDRGFTVVPYPKQLFFGVDGGTAITQANGSRYLNMGTVATGTFSGNTNPIPFRMTQDTLINKIAFRSRLSAQTGGASTGTFFVQRNGVDAGLSVAVTGILTSVTNAGASVRFAAGDTLSLRYAVTGGTNRTLTDFNVTLDMY